MELSTFLMVHSAIVLSTTDGLQVKGHIANCLLEGLPRTFETDRVLILFGTSPAEGGGMFDASVAGGAVVCGSVFAYGRLSAICCRIRRQLVIGIMSFINVVLVVGNVFFFTPGCHKSSSS
ncbi:hypothetical protein Vi05172_g1679 [Venturia inaequalis]|nr:hypothetical protein Vi05172_g1679 [Venturia inaequalis]